MSTSSLIRQDLVPMVASYLVLMTVLGIGLRLLRRSGDPPGPSARPARQVWPVRRGWPALIRQVTGTAVGGYLLLMGVVIAYYYGVARVGGQFLWSAVTGAALLVGLAAPVFAAISWLAERRRRPRAFRRHNRSTGITE